MGIVIVKDDLTPEMVQTAREEYESYLKITADLKRKIIALGGEYHADAEELLIAEEGSGNKDIWGGGYNIQTGTFETNAIINLKQPGNPSLEILDPDIRRRFLDLVQSRLENIQEYL
jgi:hypothetical protein